MGGALKMKRQWRPHLVGAAAPRAGSISRGVPEHLMGDAAAPPIRAASGGFVSEQPLLPRRRRKALGARSFPALP